MAIKNNEIYVINQPRRIIISLIVVDQDLKTPLNKDVHESLEKLREYSDLFFIFTDQHKNVDKIKFTSLYRGCGFIVSPDNKIGRSIIKALKYDLEIFSDTRNHLAITVSRITDTNKSDNYERLLMMVGKISWPVFECRTLDSGEFHNIYTITQDTLNDNGGNRSIFKTLLGMLRRKKEVDSDGIGMFNTWHSETDLLYFPSVVIERFLKGSEINFETWVDTFDTLDPRYMFASLTNLLNIKILNINYSKVKI